MFKEPGTVNTAVFGARFPLRSPVLVRWTGEHYVRAPLLANNFDDETENLARDDQHYVIHVTKMIGCLCIHRRRFLVR